EAKQLAEIIDLQQQLKLAQDQVKELESSLRIAIQTSEIATQTNFG
ncbi:2233_t:CDS:1, partial [Funneliformis geosporum]